VHPQRHTRGFTDVVDHADGVLLAAAVIAHLEHLEIAAITPFRRVLIDVRRCRRLHGLVEVETLVGVGRRHGSDVVGDRHVDAMQAVRIPGQGLGHGQVHGLHVAAVLARQQHDVTLEFTEQLSLRFANGVMYSRKSAARAKQARRSGNTGGERTLHKLPSVDTHCILLKFFRPESIDSDVALFPLLRTYEHLLNHTLVVQQERGRQAPNAKTG